MPLLTKLFLGALPYAYIKYFDEKGPTEAVLHEVNAFFFFKKKEIHLIQLLTHLEWFFTFRSQY